MAGGEHKLTMQGGINISSPVDLCNLALNKIKQANIESLSENSLQAERCQLVYNHVRRNLLAQYNWTFAIDRESLTLKAVSPNIKRMQAKEKEEKQDPAIKAATEDDTLFEYNYKHSIPDDFIRLIGVYTEHGHPLCSITSQKMPYVLEGKYILSDKPKIKIKYIKDVVNITRWSPQFTNVVVLAMAAELTQVFNDSSAFEQQILARLSLELANAKQQDCQQTMMPPMAGSPLLLESELF